MDFHGKSGNASLLSCFHPLEIQVEIEKYVLYFSLSLHDLSAG